MRKRTNVAPTHYYSLTIQRTYRRNNRGRVHRLALRGKHKQNFSLIDQRGIPVLLPLSVFSSFSYGKFCLLCPDLASLIRTLNSVVLYHCGDQDAAPVLHFMQHCINYFEFDQRKKKNFFYRELFTFLDLFSLSSKCLRNKIAWIVSIYRLHHLRHRLAMSWQCPSQAATFTTAAARRRDSPYWESRELSPGKTELRPPLVNCLSRFVLWRFWLWWAWLSTWKVTFLSSVGTFEI